MTSGARRRFRSGHTGLNVTDVGRSRRFYREVFGFDVLGESEGQGREFVFLGHGDTILLTLWQQSAGAFASERPGLHHLAFQAESMERVREVERTLRRIGAKIYHDGIVAHAEGSDSGGVFFEDPDGIRLEVFAPTGADDAEAPDRTAPTCGFF